MAKTGYYQRLQRKLFKVALFFLIVVICIIFFFLEKRVKGPKSSIELLENLRDASADSILFKTLSDSLIQEELKNWTQAESMSQSDEYEDWKCYSKYLPIMKFEDKEPLEAYLYKMPKEEITFQDIGLIGTYDIAWGFLLDSKTELYKIDPTNMSLSEGLVIGDTKKGRVMYSNGSIQQTLELPEGLIEFNIAAANYSDFPPDPQFDPNSHMVVNLDEDILGEVDNKSFNFTYYTFRRYVKPGWHRLQINYTNDTCDLAKKWDRNLFVGNIQINKLAGGVYLKIKKILEERYVHSNYTFVYFRSLGQDDRNELLRIFKSSFKIESLKEIVNRGYDITTLLRQAQICSLTKQIIFAPPPTKIRVKLKVPLGGIRLIFSYGIMEEAWNKPGEGVEFRVRSDTKENEPEVILFSKYINPKANKEDRKWFQGEVDLSRYSNKTISLIFETLGPPAKEMTSTTYTAYDYAVWSN